MFKRSLLIALPASSPSRLEIHPCSVLGKEVLNLTGEALSTI
jgi:hypothetical protein